jgi:hypothetical protein
MPIRDLPKSRGLDLQLRGLSLFRAVRPLTYLMGKSGRDVRAALDQVSELRPRLDSTSAILTMLVDLDGRSVSRSAVYQEGRHLPEFRWIRAGHGAHESRRSAISGPGGLQQKWRKSSLEARRLTIFAPSGRTALSTSCSNGARRYANSGKVGSPARNPAERALSGRGQAAPPARAHARLPGSRASPVDQSARSVKVVVLSGMCPTRTFSSTVWPVVVFRTVR